MTPLIKICGITNEEDALYCGAKGAHFLGFIFYEKSPRYVTPERAGEIIKAVKVRFPEILATGVFVNASEGEILSVAESAGLDVVQLHGDESPDFVDNLKKLFHQRHPGKIKIIKALRIRTRDDLEASLAYKSDWLLFDSYRKGEYGGTGEVFNWKLLEDFSQRERLFLSGGVGPENVVQALEQVKPFGVDLSSSLEASRGKKDKKRVDDFFSALEKAML